MTPKLIALSPAFLQLLRVGKTSAYALRPCFATRLEVYFAITAGTTGWVSCGMLVTQGGEMYLFSVDDGHVINAALLGVGKTTKANEARVEIIIPTALDTRNGTQNIHIHCRQPLDLTHLYHTNKGGGRMFPPFSYMLRFHCRNAPVALQMIRIITMFADPNKGELFVQQSDDLLERLITFASVDPAISTSPQRGAHTSGIGGGNLSSFKQIFSPGQQNKLLMRDVAKDMKKQLQSVGEDIEIPPPFDSSVLIKPFQMHTYEWGEMGIDNNKSSDLGYGYTGPRKRNLRQHALDGINEDQHIPFGSLEQTAVGPFVAAASALSQFYEGMMEKLPHFMLPSHEDVLLKYSLPGFEAQLAVFLLQPNICELVEGSVERMLSIFPGLSDGPQYRIVVREAVREEVRWSFGDTYRELCDLTRKRIDDISLDQLELEKERVEMQRSHNTVVQALLADAEARRQQMLKEETQVFFGSNHEPKLITTGQPLAPVCAEETTEWRKEVAEAANALTALELDTQRIKDAIHKDRNNIRCEEYEENQQVNNNYGPAVAAFSQVGKKWHSHRFASVREEAAFLLQQIQEQQGALARLRSKTARDGDGVKGVVMDDRTLESLRSEYNALIREQQQQIDQVKQKLWQSATAFGVNAQWMKEQSQWRGPADDILRLPHII